MYMVDSVTEALFRADNFQVCRITFVDETTAPSGRVHVDVAGNTTIDDATIEVDENGNAHINGATLIVDPNGNAYLAGGTVIRENNIVQDSFAVDRYSVSSSKVELGSAIAAELSFKLVNTNSKYDSVKFEGREVFAEVGIADWDNDGEIVWIPCGYFRIDKSNIMPSSIAITALDRMCDLDKQVDWSVITFPTTPKEIIERSCNACGVVCVTDIGALSNGNYEIKTPMSGTLTYRKLVQWCAFMTSTCAMFNALGQLELKWYTEVGFSISTAERYSSEISETDIAFTGINYRDANGNLFTHGTSDCTFDFSGCDLIQTDVLDVLPTIYESVKNFSYRPFSAAIKPAPYLFPMDKITFVTANGDSVGVVITNITFALNHATNISAVDGTNETNGTGLDDSVGIPTMTRVLKLVADSVQIVTEAKDSIADFIQNPEGFSAKVSDIAKETANEVADERFQNLDQGISESVKSTISSEIQILKNSITLSVAQTKGNGDKKAGASITLSVKDGDTTTELGKGTIDLSGVVTFSDLSTSGQTIINGDNITTGTIRGVSLYGNRMMIQRGSTYTTNQAYGFDVNNYGNKDWAFTYIGQQTSSEQIFWQRGAASDDIAAYVNVSSPKWNGDYRSHPQMRIEDGTLIVGTQWVKTDDASYRRSETGVSIDDENGIRIFNTVMSNSSKKRGITFEDVAQLNSRTVGINSNGYVTSGRGYIDEVRAMLVRNWYEDFLNIGTNSGCKNIYLGWHKTSSFSDVIIDGRARFSMLASNAPYAKPITSGWMAAIGSDCEIRLYSSSSRRYKHDISRIKDQTLDPKRLYDLPVSQYVYNDDYLDSEDERYQETVVGLIAEDVEKYYPVAAVHNDKGQVENWQERYIVPAMLYLIQDQKKQIDALSEQISELRKEIPHES